MKRIKIFSALALTLFMASCDNFELPNPPAQSNTDPDGYFENSGLVLTPVSEELNLEQANAENKYVTVANIDELINFPEAYTLTIDMEVSKDAGFTKPVTVETVISDNDVTVNPDVLNAAVQSAITKKPGTYDVNVRFLAYAVRGTTRMRLGGIDACYGTGVLRTVTLPATKVIEDSYFLIPCDAAGTPDFSKGIAMANTAGAGVSGYDNSEFAVKTTSDANGLYFKVAPASVMASKDASSLLGCIPAGEGTEGKLVVGAAAGHIALTGDILLAVNIADDSYSVNYAFEVLYPYSGSTSADKLMLLYTTNYINYSGVTAINNQWFIGTKADKKAEPLFRQSADEEAEIDEAGLTMTGKLGTGDGTTLIKTPVKGNHLYWVEVNLVQLTYSLTAINSLSVIGSANNWSNDDSVDLTPSKDFKIWTGENVHIGPEFKINANKAWDIDFGGVKLEDTTGKSVYNITMKGGNLEVNEGNYDIEVNFTTMPYVLTLTPRN